ncbi:MAG: 2-oxoacid:acceptor oxidoreductase subunit alpha [Candidatus Korarchaeota archaeon]|nr:2-oxoacid:acceptor oxidoreductase subunit alpha [Candidatus Korarchaeota archaeon]NIU85144.1 2-oxoacid:acceptor oxidoreductase subunit alpha [Candidatus Thorarchaeota archaeon]NIW15196.1 2-oxoacid:acceptor oxidoreductase subunit alpha [Candidatus Thorarchaeota archaeon]NIW53177.1 2-oxoacid:acceptor oxidoreductase subunit alpha [Candidatus Korarchaeota archaeon]
MKPQDILKPGRHFMMGDEAIAYGALYAGCKYFGGYPITPQSEIAETLSRELPKVGGFYVQMEDELASIASVIGASWTGMKAMTATSGPGFSLMQENLGYAIHTETPLVLVNVMRTGPSTGQATKGEQGDVQQARWGTHGAGHNIIALAPSSVQECFEMTVRAFNLAETYRTPVIVLADGVIGHAWEKLIVPTEIELIERKIAKKGQKNLFGDPDVAPMPVFGQGLYAHVTGSTHRHDGMRDVTSKKVHENLVKGYYEKINSHREEIAKYTEFYTDKPEILVISYGVSARPSLKAVRKAREDGINVGLLKLNTIWPFPREAVKRIASKGDQCKVLVVEMNLGQIRREIERYLPKVEGLHKIGGGIAFTSREIYERIENVAK